MKGAAYWALWFWIFVGGVMLDVACVNLMREARLVRFSRFQMEDFSTESLIDGNMSTCHKSNHLLIHWSITFNQCLKISSVAMKGLFSSEMLVSGFSSFLLAAHHCESTTRLGACSALNGSCYERLSYNCRGWCFNELIIRPLWNNKSMSINICEMVVSNASDNALRKVSDSVKRSTSSTPQWKHKPIGNCSSMCGNGTRQYEAICTMPDDNCTSQKPPPMTKPCQSSCSISVSKWDTCSVTCGCGVRKRKVNCLRHEAGYNRFIEIEISACKQAKIPLAMSSHNEKCIDEPCFSYIEEPNSWGPCSAVCGKGSQKLNIVCQRSSTCVASSRKANREKCENRNIPPIQPTKPRDCLSNCRIEWTTWSQCSVTSGVGIRTRTASCLKNGMAMTLEDCKQDKTISIDSSDERCTVETRPVIVSMRTTSSAIKKANAAYTIGENVAIRAGYTITINCIVSGYPLPLLLWSKGSKSIVSGSKLTIKNIATTDSGLYKCKAINRAGSDDASSSVTVYSPPVLETPPTSSSPLQAADMEYYVGQDSFVIATYSVTLKCVIKDGYPASTIKWILPNNKKVDNDHIVVNSDKSRITIKSTTVNDNGNYMCQATNSQGSASLSSTVTVYVPPQIVSPAQKIPTLRDGWMSHDVGNEAYGISGNVLQLTCATSTGIPPPSIKWKLPRGLTLGRQELSMRTNGTLRIGQSTGSYNGSYTCSAENAAGADTQTSVVKIYDKLGKCSVPTGRAVSSSQIDLSLRCPTVSDKHFHCGIMKYKVSYTATGGSTKITVYKTNLPKLRSLSANTLYTIRVRALYVSSYCVNSGGSESNAGTLRTLEQASTPPQSVSVCPGTTANSICLTWHRPSDVQGNFLYYEVFCDDGETEKVTRSRQTSVWFQTLTPYTNYSIVILATIRRSNGENLAGERSTAIYVRTLASRSTPPQHVLSVGWIRTVEIRWTIPRAANGPLNYYIIVVNRSSVQLDGYKDKNVGGTRKEQRAQCCYTRVSDLRPFTQYTVIVRAVNIREGDSERLLSAPSRDSVFVTGVDRPDIPRNIDLRELATSLAVSWRSPLNPNGPVDVYNLSVLNMESRMDISITMTVNTTNAVIPILALNPYTNYRVTVAAVNRNGSQALTGPIAARGFRTNDRKPVPPVCRTIAELSPTVVSINWTVPARPAYKLSFFTVYLYNWEDGILVTRNQSYSPEKSNNQSTSIKGLQPYRNYSVGLSISTNNTFVLTSLRCNFTRIATPVGKPIIPDVALISHTNDLFQFTETIIPIVLPNISLSNGPVRYIDIVVVKVTGTPLDVESIELTNAAFGENNNTYIAARIPMAEWLSGFVFVIGNESYTAEEETYFNAPLTPGTEYQIYIRPTSLSKYGEYRSLSNPYIVRTQGIYKNSKFNASGVVGGIVAMLLLSVIIVLLIVIRKKKSYFVRKTSYKGAWGETTFNGTSADEKEQTGENEEKCKPFTKHPPVRAVDFPAHVAYLKQNDEEALIAEFDALADVGKHLLATVASEQENRYKNRYQNILPYDDHRVVLQEIDGLPIPETDYINASLLDGSKPNEYIACQGPRSDTVNDMWRMIWGENVSTVVMLANFIENGKSRCAKYWSDEGHKVFDGLVVSVDATHKLAYYTVRSMTVSLNATSRVVKHYHYENWPDHGTPAHSTELLGMMKRARREKSDGVLLVHCSAGVGRTGTYMTINAMMDRIDSKQSIDVHGYVESMRGRRMEMVQTYVQYEFIYNSILEYIECGGTPAKQSNDNSSSFRKLIRRLSKSKTQQQQPNFYREFQVLEKTSPAFDKSKCATAASPTVANKNRNPDILPTDASRVILESESVSPDADYANIIPGADYINASYLDGYERRAAFIVTQYPLPDTIVDFWKMVWEQNVCTVVNLTEPDEETVTSSLQYWPDSESKIFEDFSIQMVSCEDSSSYFIRDMEIIKNESTAKVRQFHYVAWPEDGEPGNVSELLKMVSEIDQWQKRMQNPAIVVHCSTGVGRAGAFCTACNVIDQIQGEGVTEILHVAKVSKNQRPDIIPALAYYKSMVLIADQFAASRNIYGNAK